MVNRYALVAVGAFTLALSIAACGSRTSSGTSPSPAPTPSPTPGPTPPPSTTFQGTIAGSGGQSGTLPVVVQAQVASIAPFDFPVVALRHAQCPGVLRRGNRNSARGGRKHYAPERNL
jgi:hypothetical protein